MSIIRWAPMYDPFEEMDKALESFDLRSQLKSFAPAMDVYQTKDSVVVETALPNIDPEKVDVSIENDVLTVKGDTEKKSEVEDKNYYRKEMRYGSFYRSVALPTHVQGEKAKAEYADGVLKISIPKAPEVKPKTIKIKATKAKK